MVVILRQPTLNASVNDRKVNRDSLSRPGGIQSQVQQIMDSYDFKTVYEDTKNIVWMLVSKYVHAREDREDLFQEVFLRIHKALPRFRGESAMNTWIYKITVNTALNYLNRHNRYKTFKNLFNSFRHIEEASMPEAEYESSKLLEKLNPKQRMILILSDVEEKSLSEIAEALKMPVGTVKSNLHRAREILKKEVEINGQL